MVDENLTLVMETTQGAGSVALFDWGRLLFSLSGEESFFMSRDIMRLVSEVLQVGGVKKEQLGKILLSAGPGSSTGLRVGESLAKGMSGALGIVYQRVSLLDSFFLLCCKRVFSPKSSFLCVLWVGRDEVGFSYYRGGGQVGGDCGDASFCKAVDFAGVLSDFWLRESFVLVVSDLHYDFLESVCLVNTVFEGEICRLSGSLAEIMGLAWLK